MKKLQNKKKGEKQHTEKEKSKTLTTVLRILKKEARNYNVPVVTMIATNKGNPFKVLIATVLSLRTRDEMTLEASKRLFAAASTPKTMLKLGEKEIAKHIYPVGFYNIKAKNIEKICDILLQEHNAKVPKTMSELLQLPNVGRKTANLVLTLGHGIVEGIAIDTHCHRIPNRMGIITTKDPDATEQAIMRLLPKKEWIHFNDVFVAFGQGRCKPIGPLCKDCPVTQYCNYEKKQDKAKARELKKKNE